MGARIFSGASFYMGSFQIDCTHKTMKAITSVPVL